MLRNIAVLSLFGALCIPGLSAQAANKPVAEMTASTAVTAHRAMVRIQVDWNAPEVQGRDVHLFVCPSLSPDWMFTQSGKLIPGAVAQRRVVYLGEQNPLPHPESYVIVLAAVKKGAIRNDKPLRMADWAKVATLLTSVDIIRER